VYPLLMGIVNVTPDSFSDGGLWLEPARAVEHGLRLADEGADLLDVGGESTRPGAGAVDVAEELRRVLPVVRGLAERAAVPISIDTRHAAVARAALEAGASIVNDVAPIVGDVALAQAVREAGAGLVLMHMRGTPQTMSGLAAYDDVVREVEDALEQAVSYAVGQGIARECLVVDPGIGFAKTTAQNVALLASLGRFDRLAPVLVGASRKRFIGELCGEASAQGRLGGSVGAAVWCVLNGASVVRVHDVKETRQACTVVRALSEGAEDAHV
jgi:dihydropteroate synthase